MENEFSIFQFSDNIEILKMKKFIAILKKIKKWALTIFGDIKIYRFPCFLIYCPDTFKVNGLATRRALELLKPGDIVLRKYVHYLDGYFIPGKYSHSSIYVGNGKIIHSVADGVEFIDVIDFLRCDGFCILRQKDEALAKEACDFAIQVEGDRTKYDFDFNSDNNAYYCHELVATAYSKLNIKKKPVVMFKFFKLAPRYLAESFLEDERFEEVMSY